MFNCMSRNTIKKKSVQYFIRELINLYRLIKQTEMMDKYINILNTSRINFPGLKKKIIIMPKPARRTLNPNSTDLLVIYWLMVRKRHP